MATTTVLTQAQKNLLTDLATDAEPVVRVWNGTEYRWQHKGRNVTRVARSLIRKALLDPKYPEVGGEAGVSRRGEALAKALIEQMNAIEKNQKEAAATASKRGSKRKRGKRQQSAREPEVDRAGRGFAAHGHRTVTSVPH
jgi:hypothetical protein